MAKTKKNLCEKCTGMCCRYIALPIETPEDRSDFDDIRWYLCHENISVFVEQGDWYLNVKTNCRNLSETDYKCKIYDKRPKICRGYKTDDCDMTDADYDYELHFTSDQQMEEYMRVKFDNNVRNRKKKTKKKAKKK
jgi:Fe-S-cluster containining protein